MKVVLLIIMSFFMVNVHARKLSINTKNKSDNVTPFRPQRADILRLYQMMKDVTEILSASNIVYWIDGGTLLGAVRHRGLIPWDDDLDICMFLQDEQRLLALRELFEKLNYGVAPTFFGYKIFPKSGKPIPGFLWNYPFLDIFLMVQQEARIYYKKCGMIWGWRHGEEIFITQDELFPLKEYKFGEIFVQGPHKYQEHFLALYGTDWMTTGYQWFDHQKEKIFEKIKFTITQKDKVPAKPTGPLEERVAKLLLLTN